MIRDDDAPEFAALWLKQTPGAKKLVGRKMLTFIGSGGRAIVFLIGANPLRELEPRLVLKITNDPSDAYLSLMASREKPIGIVPIEQVVASSVLSPPRERWSGAPRTGVRTWGIFAALAFTPAMLRELSDMDPLGEELNAEVVADTLEEAAENLFNKVSARAEPVFYSMHGDLVAGLEWMATNIGMEPGTIDIHSENVAAMPSRYGLPKAVFIDLGQGDALREEQERILATAEA